jgi:hypothetical protein
MQVVILTIYYLLIFSSQLRESARCIGFYTLAYFDEASEDFKLHIKRNLSIGESTERQLEDLGQFIGL